MTEEKLVKDKLKHSTIVKTMNRVDFIKDGIAIAICFLGFVTLFMSILYGNIYVRVPAIAFAGATAVGIYVSRRLNRYTDRLWRERE